MENQVTPIHNSPLNTTDEANSNASVSASSNSNEQVDTVALEKITPHNIEAEQALLGALLLNNNVYEQCSELLNPEHFFDPVHARIYSAIVKLLNNNNLVSPVTLRTYLEDDAGLQELGGATYLARLVSHATTLSNARHYGRTIFDLARRRTLIMAGEEMIANARNIDIDDDPDQQIERAESALYQLGEKGVYDSGFMSFETSIVEALGFASRAFGRDGKLSGLGTNFTALDDMLGGLQKSDLVILAGRPAMGKTALATNIAFHIARQYARAKAAGNYKTDETGDIKMRDGGIVGFFSLEMSAEQLTTRILADNAEIYSSKIRKGDIEQIDYDRFAKAARELNDVPLYIDHTGAIPVATLATRARRLKRQHGLDLIVVDYLQLVRPSATKQRDGRVQEVSEITQALKALAKELDVPVLALSQLSRQVESRDDKRPQLADLRDSGTIEQDADIVMFVYRAAYYHGRNKPDEGSDKFIRWQEEMERLHDKAELIIGKNRHGPIGQIDLTFDARFTRFSNPPISAEESPIPPHPPHDDDFDPID